MIPLLATHVWQSTVVAGIAFLLTRLLRTDQARVRYAVWLTASAKFLVPFSVLAAIGHRFAWRTSSQGPHPALEAARTAIAPLDPLTRFAVPEGLAASAEFAGAPALPVVSASTILQFIWVTGIVLVLAAWAVRWWRLRRILRAATPVWRGRERDLLGRAQRACGSPDVPLLASSAPVEPAIVGFLRPVVLWPQTIGRRLTDAEVEAIFLHELMHARRGDNLSALMHMAVQTVFWFHPLVWWIGLRLIEEREVACDEEVVRLGVDPHLYAESILRTCEYAIESPLVCVAGVTGADLKRRVVAIVGRRPAERLGRVKLGLIAAIGTLVAGGPLVAGALTPKTDVPGTVAEAPRRSEAVMVMRIRRGAPQVADAPTPVPPSQAVRWRLSPLPATPQAADQVGPRFEVASVKRIDPNASEAPVRVSRTPGEYFRTASSVRALLLQSYQVPFVAQIGGPDWIQEPYEINAKLPDDVERTPENLRAMIRNLLADRFKLVLRDEVQELPIFALVRARSDGTLGPDIHAVTTACGDVTPEPQECRSLIQSGRGVIAARNMPFSSLATTLEYSVARPVIDRTGIAGDYDFGLSYADLTAAGANADGPSLFTAIEEQLGLKLESTRGPVRVLVIEKIQRPTED